MREQPLGQTHTAVAETEVFSVFLSTGVASASLDGWIETLVSNDGQTGSDHMKQIYTAQWVAQSYISYMVSVCAICLLCDSQFVCLFVGVC